MKKLLLFTTLLSLSLSSYARIGESAMNIKSRFASRNAACYAYTDKNEQYREILEMPYKDLLFVMPKDTAHAFYFRRGDGKSPTAADTTDQFDLDGWEIHIATYKNMSVLETYRRHPFMNPEELARLLRNLVKDRENVTWIATTDFVKGEDTEQEDDDINTTDQIMKHIYSILPKVKNKKIELEIPKEFISGTSFNDSLAKRMYTEARDKAFERKKSEVEADRERVLQSTARKTTKQRQDNKDSSTKKMSAMGVSGASSLGSINLKTERDAVSTEVKFTTTVPNQEDTALGFNYISTDGALRAKIILGSGNVPLGLLVVDTRYDKLLRKVMDDLYTKQSRERDDEAQKSVSAF